jgi:hypothetical protein
LFQRRGSIWRLVLYCDATEEDQEQFLEHGNPATLDPFLTAFAKAIQHMPVLDTFTLRCEVNLFLGDWEVSYYAAGVKTDWNADGGKDTSEV